MVQEREKELQPLYDRMDLVAKQIATGDPNSMYQMMRLDIPSKPVDHVVNIKLNLAASYCENLKILMTGAISQCVVEGYKNNRPLNDKEKAKIEDFVSIQYDIIDDILVNSGEDPFMSWAADQMIKRGGVCGYQMASIEDGIYIPEFVKWDRRYAAYEYDRNKIAWGSFRWLRKPSSLKRHYPDAEIREKDVLNGLVNGFTFVDDKVEEIWVNDHLVSSKPHMFKETPVIIQRCYSGSTFQDSDHIANQGESAIFLNLDLYDEKNRAASIEATLAMKAIHPAYQKTRKDGGAASEGTNGQAGPAYPDKAGAVTEVYEGEEYQLLQVADLKQSAMMAKQDIDRALQLGGQDVDVGNTSDMSMVAIAKTEEIRNKALNPGLAAIAVFKQKHARLMINQYLALLGAKLKVPAELGVPGRKKTFSKSDFDCDFSIRFNYQSKSKEMDIANLALFISTEGKLPDKVRYETILQAENPGEWMALMDSQKAEQIDPIIGIQRRGLALCDEAEELEGDAKDAKLIESMVLCERQVAIIMSRKNPQAQLEPEQAKQAGNGAGNILPKMLGGNSGASQTANAEKVAS
jgi:hypothetical protein